uniref:Uncharacterized protein n=1 Tax=Moniliophthora roreri TaxID=221103 RepID=A0A0W0G1R4_MONRR
MGVITHIVFSRQHISGIISPANLLYQSPDFADDSDN